MTGLEARLLELCYEIEKLPASEQQTNVVTIASELLRKVQAFNKSISSSDNL